MSKNISQSDYVKSIHRIFVPKHHCNCQMKTIDTIKQCLYIHLQECNEKDLLSKVTKEELDAINELLKSTRYNAKHVSGLVHDRKCIDKLRDSFEKYLGLSNPEKDKLMDKLEPENIPDFLKSIKTIIASLRPLHIDQNDKLPTKRGERKDPVNQTEWMRSMYKALYKVVYDIPGRVRWKEEDGEDPHNAHVCKDGEKKFTRKDDLMSMLKDLVSDCIEKNVCIPRPYQEEIQLLNEFLEGRALNTLQVQREQKLRKLVLSITDVLLTLRRRELSPKSELTRISEVLWGIEDFESKLNYLTVSGFSSGVSAAVTNTPEYPVDQKTEEMNIELTVEDDLLDQGILNVANTDEGEIHQGDQGAAAAIVENPEQSIAFEEPFKILPSTCQFQIDYPGIKFAEDTERQSHAFTHLNVSVSSKVDISNEGDIIKNLSRLSECIKRERDPSMLHEIRTKIARLDQTAKESLQKSSQHSKKQLHSNGDAGSTALSSEFVEQGDETAKNYSSQGDFLYSKHRYENPHHFEHSKHRYENPHHFEQKISSSGSPPIIPEDCQFICTDSNINELELFASLFEEFDPPLCDKSLEDPLE